mgnify:FL=1
MNWFDSHCHLKGFKDKGIVEEILRRAEENGVSRMTAVGTSSDDWEIYKNLSKQYRDKIFYSVGLHPCYVNEGYEIEIEKIESYLGSETSPVAFGEIGLDYFHLPKNHNDALSIIRNQKIAFSEQLKIAAQYSLPTIIHSRKAFRDCITIIEQSGLPWDKVLFHCFSEGVDEIKELNDRGGLASFTGILTFKNNEFLREALQSQGIAKLILETDSPYLAPEPKRGKQNEPSYLPLMGEFLSGYLKVPLEEIAQQSYCNASEFYGLEFG